MSEEGEEEEEARARAGEQEHRRTGEQENRGTRTCTHERWGVVSRGGEWWGGSGKL